MERRSRDQSRQLGVKLTRDVTIRSDRGKKKTLDEIKVNLHGQTGSIEVHTTVDPINPWKVDVPKASRSAGW